MKIVGRNTPDTVSVKERSQQRQSPFKDPLRSSLCGAYVVADHYYGTLRSCGASLKD